LKFSFFVGLDDTGLSYHPASLVIGNPTVVPVPVIAGHCRFIRKYSHCHAGKSEAVQSWSCFPNTVVRVHIQTSTVVPDQKRRNELRVMYLASALWSRRRYCFGSGPLAKLRSSLLLVSQSVGFIN
jgi:hypothetical protein